MIKKGGETLIRILKSIGYFDKQRNVEKKKKSFKSHVGKYWVRTPPRIPLKTPCYGDVA